MGVDEGTGSPPTYSYCRLPDPLDSQVAKPWEELWRNTIAAPTPLQKARLTRRATIPAAETSRIAVGEYGFQDREGRQAR